MRTPDSGTVARNDRQHQQVMSVKKMSCWLGPSTFIQVKDQQEHEDTDDSNHPWYFYSDCAWRNLLVPHDSIHSSSTDNNARIIM